MGRPVAMNAVDLPLRRKTVRAVAAVGRHGPARWRGFVQPIHAAGGAVLVLFVAVVGYAALMGLSSDSKFKNRVAAETVPARKAAQRRVHKVRRRGNVGVPQPGGGPAIAATRKHHAPRAKPQRHGTVVSSVKRPAVAPKPAASNGWPVRLRVRRVAYRHARLDPKHPKKNAKKWDMFSPSETNESSGKLLSVIISIENRSASKSITYRPWSLRQGGDVPRLTARGKSFPPLYFNHFFVHGALHAVTVIKPQAAVRDRLVFRLPPRGDTWRLVFPGRDLGLKGFKDLLVKYKRRRSAGQ